MRRSPWTTLCLAVFLAACDAGDGGDDARGRPDGIADGAAGEGTGGDAADAFDPGGGTEIARQSVGPEGGMVSSWDAVPGRRIRLEIPAGALSKAVEIVIRALPEDPADPWAIPDTVYRLQPDGLSFAVPATLAIGCDAARVRVAATPADLAIHKAWPDGWRRVPGGAADASVAVAALSGFSDYAVRVLDPYAAAPALSEAWSTEQPEPLSDRTGALRPVQVGESVYLRGEGFGYDLSAIEVRLGGRLQDPPLAGEAGFRASGNRLLLLAPLALPGAAPAPGESRDYSLAVTVKGKASNVLTLRVAQPPITEVPRIDRVFPPQAPRGGRVILEGFFPERAERRFTVGGLEATLEGIGPYGEARITLPPDLPAGDAQVVVHHGPLSSEPAVLHVWKDEAPVLAAGIGAAGVAADQGSNEGVVSLLFDATDWLTHRRYEEDGSPGPVAVRTRFAIATPAGDADVHTAWCGGQPGGRCSLPVPEALFAGLKAGDPVTVTAHVPEIVVGAGWTLEDRERVSAPLQLVLATGPLAGLRHSLAPHDDGFWPPAYGNAALPRLRLARGDVLCFVRGPGRAAGEADRLLAPGLWSGELLAPTANTTGDGAEPSFPQCVPLPQPGTFTVTAPDRGASVEIEVRLDGGEGAYEMSLPSGRDMDLGVGGARLHVPAGAFGSATMHRVDLTADTGDLPGAPPLRDAAMAPARTRYSLQMLRLDPQRSESYGAVPALVLPVTLSLPYDPSRCTAPPEIEFQGPDGSAWVPLVKADAAAGLVTFTFPAGTYAARDPVFPGSLRTIRSMPATPGAVPPPIALGDLTRSVGVSYHVLEEGVLEDTDGWFRLEYVTDPNSEHHATEAYARDVLTQLTAAYRTLKDLGWLEPAGVWAADPTQPVQTRVRLRHWADANTPAYTDSGWFGTVDVSVRTGLPLDDTNHGAWAHEVGHVFQRTYTLNATLSWLDEGMAEWAAFKTLGNRYVWDPDMTAAGIPLHGFPNRFWGGYPPGEVYGTSGLVIWFASAFGDDAIRKLYLGLATDTSYWQDPRKLFTDVSGTGMPQQNFQFAKAFWRQAYDPVSRDDALGQDLETTLQNLAPPLTSRFIVADENGLTLGGPMAPYSSTRVLVSLPDPLAASMADGDLVLRSSGPNPGPYEVLVVPENSRTSARPPVGDGITLEALVRPGEKVAAPFPKAYWVIPMNSSPDTESLTLRVAFPRLKSVVPTSAKAGDGVMIAGHDFGSAPGTVKVGGKVATVGLWADGQINFTMPSIPLATAADVVVVTSEQARTNSLTIGVLP